MFFKAVSLSASKLLPDIKSENALLFLLFLPNISFISLNNCVLKISLKAFSLACKRFLTVTSLPFALRALAAFTMASSTSFVALLMVSLGILKASAIGLVSVKSNSTSVSSAISIAPS